MIGLLFISFIIISSSSSLHPVYRLIQYQHSNTLLGSQVSSLNFLAAHYLNTQQVPRKVAVIKLSELSQSNWHNLIRLMPSGVLIIINSPSPDWPSMKELFGTSSFSFPIYFTLQNEEILNVYHSLQNIGTGILADQFQFIVTTDEKQPIKNLQIENLYGFIYEYSENLPTIALVAHYDAFSIVPELAKSGNKNGSGAIALLEIGRVFSGLFQKNLPGYNLLLLASSAGTWNYQGIFEWLEAKQSQIQDIANNVVFALCLDSIGSDNKLNFHISRFHKENENQVIKFYNAANQTIKATGKQVGYVKKKVSMVDPYIPWPHEQFAKNKIVSATLSELELPVSILDRDSFQEMPELDLKVLNENIRFVSEILLKFLYNIDDESLKVYSKEDLVSEENLKGLQRQFLNETRFVTKLTGKNGFNQFLEEELGKYTGSSFRKQKFKLNEYELYPSKEESLNIYKVKSAILDFYIFLGILAYIGLLWGASKLFSMIKFSPKKHINQGFD